jgi:hypothetical protein
MSAHPPLDRRDQHEERRQEVKTYLVRAYHRDCGGQLLNQGFGTTDTFHKRWMHRCDQCTKLVYLDKCYPYEESECALP